MGSQAAWTWCIHSCDFEPRCIVSQANVIKVLLVCDVSCHSVFSNASRHWLNQRPINLPSSLQQL